MKIALFILALFTTILGYRVLQLESQVNQLETNTAIAVLSAEAANNKIGAIAPFFAEDKEAFARAWIDSVNMPSAVIPEEVLIPIKRTLEERRSNAESQQMLKATFK